MSDLIDFPELVALLVIYVIVGVPTIITWSWKSLFFWVAIVAALFALSTVFMDGGEHWRYWYLRAGNVRVAPPLYLLVGVTCFVLARAGGIYMQSRGWSRWRAMRLDLIGFILPFMLVLRLEPLIAGTVATAPVPEACLERPAPVRLLEQRFNLPNYSISEILYRREDDETAVWIYLSSEEYLDEFCKASRNGTNAVPAQGFYINVQYVEPGGFLLGNREVFSYVHNQFCARRSHPVEQAYCQASEEGKLREFDALRVFVPESVGDDRGWILSGIEASFLKAGERDPWILEAKRLEAEGAVERYANGFLRLNGDGSEPATAFCYALAEPLAECHARTNLDGLAVEWAFQAEYEARSENFVRSYEAVLQLLEAMKTDAQ